MRVLHVVDPAFPGGGGCTLRQLSAPRHRIRSVEQRVVVLGHGAHADLARRCGVPVDGTIPVPAGRPLLAARALRRLVSVWERSDGPYDIFQAWSLGAAVALGAAIPDRPRLAWASIGPVSEPGLAILRRATRRRPVPILTGDLSVRAAFIRAGFDRHDLSVLPAAVDPEAIEHGRRGALRGRWGVSKREFVLGLLAEPVRWGDTHELVDVLARLAVSGRPIRLLVHGAAGRRVDAIRWLRELGRPGLVLVDDEAAEPWRVTPGLDAVVVPAAGLGAPGRPFARLTPGGAPETNDVALVGRLGRDGPERVFGVRGLLLGGDRIERPSPGVAPVLWAMAAGLPVVVPPTSAAARFVRDGVNGLVAEAGIGPTADAIARLHDEPELAARLGSAARETIVHDHHVSAFCVRLREAWTRLFRGESVHVPDPADTDAAAAAARISATGGDDEDLEWFDRSRGTWVNAGETGNPEPPPA